MKIIAVIQVRLNSSRLPRKAFARIISKTSLEWVIESVKKSKLIDDFIVATTSDRTDDDLVEFLQKLGIKFFRGDEQNVAKRLFEAGKTLGADHIVRIVGDHPLNSFELLDYVLERHLKENNAFSSLKRENISVGVLSEVINMNAFERLFSYDLDFSFSEYLTYFFTNNKDIFKVKLYSAPKEFRSKKYRLTLDNKDDFIMLEKLISEIKIKKLEINYTNVLKILNSNPNIANINIQTQQKFLDVDLNEKIYHASKIKL